MMNTKVFVIIAAVLVAAFGYFFTVFFASQLAFTIKAIGSVLGAVTVVGLAYLVFKVLDRK